MDSNRRRFEPYPEYRDAGVEWLGEIPAHWDARRLKHLAQLNPESLPEDTDVGFVMAYVDIGGVDSFGRIVEKENLTFGAAPSRARRIVRSGDVIVSTVRTYLRAIAPIVNPEPNLVVSTGFAVVRPSDDLATEYAAYALRAPYFVDRVVASSKGVSFPAINESEMATYPLAVPPSHEQRAIAAFLDRETGKIDALVAKKERLIELLQEKRTALITQAVTKGLDPNVSLKDSGVEWLGEIPAYWESCTLGTGFTVQGGFAYRSEDFAIDGIPLVRMSNLKMGALDLAEAVKIPESIALPAFSLREGDLLVGMSGSIENYAWVGGPDTPCQLNQRVGRIKERTARGYLRFAMYLFNSAPTASQVNLLSEGTAQQNISAWQIERLRVALPPRSEQCAIAAFLDRETEKLDALSEKIRDAIDRLKEFRTALISTAVTGKIDVRGGAEE